MRLWLENCIIFLFSDCTDETMDEYEVIDEDYKDDMIPQSVMWPFMNSPLWPLGVKAYWIRVPNIKQVEQESGATVCPIRFHACARLSRLAASLRTTGTVCLAVYVSVVCVLSTYTGTRSAVTVVLRDAYVLYTYVLCIRVSTTSLCLTYGHSQAVCAPGSRFAYVR